MIRYVSSQAVPVAVPWLSCQWTLIPGTIHPVKHFFFQVALVMAFITTLAKELINPIWAAGRLFFSLQISLPRRLSQLSTPQAPGFLSICPLLLVLPWRLHGICSWLTVPYVKCLVPEQSWIKNFFLEHLDRELC